MEAAQKYRAYVAAAFLAFFPSSITAVKWVDAPSDLPKKVQAGDVITINKPANLDSIYLQGAEFLDAGDRMLIGSGTSGRSPLYIHGLMRATSSFFDFHPTLTFFRHDVDVQYPAHPRVRLNLPREVIRRLSAADDEILKTERTRMRNAIHSSSGEIRRNCWAKPLNSRIVSKFASPRTLPDGRKYYHSGLDMRAAKGTPIRAPASSRVLFAEHQTVPGNVVVLDHGGGLTSRYMHLSEIQVRPGDDVEKGQIIGLSGATGRVEAPHLHWEVLLRGIPVNPIRFLQAWEQFCDPT